MTPHTNKEKVTEEQSMIDDMDKTNHQRQGILVSSLPEDVRNEICRQVLCDSNFRQRQYEVAVLIYAETGAEFQGYSYKDGRAVPQGLLVGAEFYIKGEWIFHMMPDLSYE
jgi:hypothetical protein